MSNVADDQLEGKPGWFARLRQGLAKTRDGLSSRLDQIFAVGKAIDQTLLDEIETLLITSDFGMPVTEEVIQVLTKAMSRKSLKDAEAVRKALKSTLVQMIESSALPLPQSDAEPLVVLMVGVNGAGKTTTAGKLAYRFKSEGRQVILAAGDTYRAAAVEQLKIWGERNGVDVVAQQTGADSASVIFDALSSAKAKGADVLIADTAGRLQNKANLMQELEKIVRVMNRIDESAPHSVLLVIDGGTGQNALVQAREFKNSVPVSGLVVTKLDGTAKGGVMFALARELGLPIHFIGVGEQLDDLRPFDAKAYVEAIFDAA